MALTCLLTVLMMANLFLMIWVATIFMPIRALADFFPADVQERLQPRLDEIDRAGMTPRRALGTALFALTLLAYATLFVWAAWDGIAHGFSFGQFLARFCVMGFGVKIFDVVCLDWFLLGHTRFFPHYLPETEGCAGWHKFGYNRTQQLRQMVMVALLCPTMAWLCTLF